MREYRNVNIEVERGPSWAEQSLTALVEAEEPSMSERDDSLSFPSLAEMAAAEDDDFGDE